MLGVVAICLIPLLAVPSLLVVAALELSTPSPVYFDLQQFRFRRHSQYEHKDAENTGPDFAARAGAYEPPPLTEDEALTALAVQMSLDSAAEAEAEAEAGRPQERPLVEMASAAPTAAVADAELAPAPGAREEEAPAGGEGAADAAGALEATPM